MNFRSIAVSLSPSVALVLVLFACTREPVKPVVNNGVVINEIAAKGGDWIEIYNTTASAVSLSGYKLYDDPASPWSVPSLTLAPGGFVVFDCTGTGIGNAASFSLSSLGETVTLEDDKGNVVDEVDFPPLTGSQSYARFPDGGADWLITGVPSRGTSNGQGQYPTIRNARRSPTVPGLQDLVTVTAEVSDAKGISSVKLYRRTLGGAWQSADMSLSGSVWSASIPALGTTGTVEYYMEAKNIDNRVTFQPSAGSSAPYSYLLNTDALPALVINEYLAYNTTCCPDNDGGVAEYDDWVEIYNPGNSPVDLAGYYLSDSLANPFKFRIASGDPSRTTVPANGYLVVVADEQGTQGILHASFRLNQLGEQIGLFYIDGRSIDQRTFGIQSVNQSEGRSPNGSSTWKKMTPTRGAANN